jgi:hypothetical protein
MSHKIHNSSPQNDIHISAHKHNLLEAPLEHYLKSLKL